MAQPIDERRMKLHAKLKDILGSDHVEYDPPESVKLTYPCIVYSRDTLYLRNADSHNYRNLRRYKVQLITRESDSPYIDKIVEAFPMLQHSRHFVTDNLHHDEFRIYF